MSEVSEFLLRVRELGEKTDREDELRAKQLEEEIAEGRRRRQALRAERARSLSPEKRMDSTPMRRPEDDVKEVKKPIINLNDSPAPRISPRPIEKNDTDRSELEKRKEERIAQLKALRMREIEKRAAAEEEEKSQKERDLELERQRQADDLSMQQENKKAAESPLSDSKLSRAEEIKRQITSIVGPSGTLSVFPGEKPAPAVNSTPTRPTAKRVASGPKPQVAPKPSTLTSPLNKENTSPTVLERTSTTNFAALNRARMGHAKANSVSFIEGTPKLDTNTPPAGSFLASRSPTRHESPTRGGFIRSAMLKRENTVRSSSPANSSFSREILLSSSPEGHHERSPPAPIRTATLHAAPIVSRSSPNNDKNERPIKPARPLSMAAVPSSTSLASSPPLPRDNSSHSSLSDFSISPIVQRRAENNQYINSTPSALWRSNTVRAENATMSTSDSIESISSIASSSISREGTPSRARSLTPAHSSPAANLSTGTVDSRRWSPVRQQPSWLESALKKNGPPTPGQEQGLVRSGTIARTPSRSPVKNGHNRTMSFDRPPLSSPLDLARESPLLRREDSIVREPAKPTPPPKSSNLSGVYSANSSFNSSFTRTTSVRQADRSLDKSIDEDNLAPAILRKNSLRPPAPKPNVASKTSPEAIERLRSLRHQTMNRFEARDEAKETLERLKSGLRRSNTVQYKAPDELKDSVLAAKSSLKMNTSIKEEDEEEAEIPETQPKKQLSFHDSLASALAQGPPSAGAQPRRAHTFDSSFDANDEVPQKQSTQLTHMTKRRAKGPKRRLPTSVKGGSVSTPNLVSQLNHQQNEDTFKLRTVQLSAAPVTPSGKPVPLSLIPGNGDSPAHSPVRNDGSAPTTPLSVVKNRNNAGRARPAIRSSSRTVSAKLANNNGTSPTRSPPKPRTPSSQVRIKTQI